MVFAFPLGLFGLLPSRAVGYVIFPGAAGAAVVIGWMVYATFAMAVDRAKSTGRFFIIYFLFCLLLLLNLVGCKTIEAHGF